MEQPRVIGHVVSVNGFRLKVELAPEAKSSSRATLDGVQRAVAINSFLTFDLGAGTHAIGNLSDLEARESYDPTQDDELSLELTKPRRIASVQLLGTVRQLARGQWVFDTGITVLPTLDTPAEVANPEILSCVFGHRRNETGHKVGRRVISILPWSWAIKPVMKIRGSRRLSMIFFPPLAIVGNTGSGKSYTVASLLRGVIENEKVSAAGARDPHIFILDINGEYANAFLSEEQRKYTPEPNQAYVNGKKLSVPIWLMNSEEVCEWLSASEQTQQPVLKAWWAFLKGKSAGEAKAEADFLAEALAAIQRMYPLNALSKNQARALYLAISDFLSETAIDFKPLEDAINPYLAKQQNGEYKNFYGDPVDNGVAINAALTPLIAAIEDKIARAPAASK